MAESTSAARSGGQCSDAVARDTGSADQYLPGALPAAPFPHPPLEQILDLHVSGKGATNPIIFGISWSASGTKLAVAAIDRRLRVWERVPYCTSTPSRVMNAGESVPARVACHPHSSLIAATYLDKRVRVWDGTDLISTWKDLWGTIPLFYKMHSKMGHDQHLAAVRWCPQGLRLAAATTKDKGVVVWEAGDRTAWEGLRGADPLLLCRHSAATCAVAWGPEGSRLAWGADDGRLGVCDMGRPGEVVVALGGREAIWSIDWNWAGAGAGGAASTGCVAAGGRDRAVRLWDVSSGAQAGVLVGHSCSMTEVAWRPGDAYTMASVCTGGRVIVWDVRTCRALQRLQFLNRSDGHSPVVGTSVAWSPDGAMLAAGAHDGRVVVWG